MVYRTASVVFGVFFAITGFICLLVAISTTYWLDIRVDENKIGGNINQLAYLPRHRGLFMECFSDLTQTNRDLLADTQLEVKDSDCIYTDFSTEKVAAYEANNKMRSDLMIAEVAFLILSAILIFFAFVIFCFSLCIDARTDPKKWSLAMTWIGIVLFVAAFANAVGMAFFHAAEFLETQKIAVDDSQAPYPYFYLLTQPEVLKQATSRFYFWSYALSWLAVFCEILSALILFLSGVCSRPKHEKTLYEASTMNSAHSYGHRNKAYEYAEGKMPQTIIQTAPTQMVTAEGPAYYEHFRGPHFDPYSRRSNNQPDFAPQYNFDDGGWRWQ